MGSKFLSFPLDWGRDRPKILHHAWSNSDRILAVATDQSQIHFFEDEGSPSSSPSSSTAAGAALPLSLQWHPWLPLVAVAWEDGKVTVINYQTKASRDGRKVHSTPVKYLEWAPTGNRMITADEKGTVAIWKVDQRGSIGLCSQYKVKGTVTQCAFVLSSAQRENIHSMTISSVSSPYFVFGGQGGILYYADDLGHMTESQKLNSPIDRILFDHVKSRLVIITSNLYLVQLSLHGSGSMEVHSRVKLSISGEKGITNALFVGEGLLAASSGEGFVRFWDLHNGDNFILGAEEAGAHSGDKINFIEFQHSQQVLVAGTEKGKLLLWKYQKSKDKGRKRQEVEPEDHWHALPPLKIGAKLSETAAKGEKSIKYVSCCHTDQILCAVVVQTQRQQSRGGSNMESNTNDNQELIHSNDEQDLTHEIVIYNQFKLTQALFPSAAVLQKSEKKLEIYPRQSMQKAEEASDVTSSVVSLQSNIKIRGFYCNDSHAVVWNGSQAEVHSFGVLSTSIVACFPTNGLFHTIKGDKVFAFSNDANNTNFSSPALMGSKSDVCASNAGFIQSYTLTGKALEIHPFAEEEGFIRHFDCCGDFLAMSTSTGIIKVFSTKDGNLQALGPNRKFQSDVPPYKSLGNIRSLKVSRDGTKVSLTASSPKVSLHRKNALSNKIFVLNTATDKIEYCQFEETHTVVNHFWDFEDARVLCCEVEKEYTGESRSQPMSQASLSRLDSRGHGEDPKAPSPSPPLGLGLLGRGDREVHTLLVTDSHGLSQQAATTLEAAQVCDCLGVSVPYLYFGRVVPPGPRGLSSSSSSSSGLHEEEEEEEEGKKEGRARSADGRGGSKREQRGGKAGGRRRGGGGGGAGSRRDSRKSQKEYDNTSSDDDDDDDEEEEDDDDEVNRGQLSQDEYDNGHAREEDAQGLLRLRGVYRQRMRDFMGIESLSPAKIEAVLHFSACLSSGNMEEAYKAVTRIESSFVWENMARMCVRTRRMDVARVCFAEMKELRALAAMKGAMNRAKSEGLWAAADLAWSERIRSRGRGSRGEENEEEGDEEDDEGEEEEAGEEQKQQVQQDQRQEQGPVPQAREDKKHTRLRGKDERKSKKVQGKNQEKDSRRSRDKENSDPAFSQNSPLSRSSSTTATLAKSMQRPESDPATAAMVALQLGATSEAGNVYKDAQRFDLLTKMYEAGALWEEAVETAEKESPIVLSSTLLNYGRYLHQSGDLPAAVQYYNRSEAQRQSVLKHRERSLQVNSLAFLKYYQRNVAESPLRPNSNSNSSSNYSDDNQTRKNNDEGDNNNNEDFSINNNNKGSSPPTPPLHASRSLLNANFAPAAALALLRAGKVRELEDFAKRNQDNVALMQWYGHYLERENKVKKALHCFKRAGDVLAMVRLYVAEREMEKAAALVESKQDRAAALFLAHQLERLEHAEDAMHFFVMAGRYNHAIRVGKAHGLTSELMKFASRASPSCVLEVALYMEERGETAKAVQLYQKGGNMPKALQLCFQNKLFDVLAATTDEILRKTERRSHKCGPEEVEDADGSSMGSTAEMLSGAAENGREISIEEQEVLQQCAAFFLQHRQFDRAVQLLLSSKKYDEAITMCVKNNIEITEDMAEKFTLPKSDDSNREKQRISLLNKVAKCCKRTGSFHLAAKKYTQAGDKVKAMKCLVKAGDNEKIIYFAGVCRNREVYILAANYLQSCTHQRNPAIARAIVNFYTKAKAFEQLVSYYDATAQMEIAEYSDYSKAAMAIKEAIKYIKKSTSPTKSNTERSLLKRAEIIDTMMEAQTLSSSDPARMIQLLHSLLGDHVAASFLRLGDVFTMMFNCHYQQGNFQEAYSVLQKMSHRNIRVEDYLESSMIKHVHRQVKSKSMAADDDEAADEAEAERLRSKNSNASAAGNELDSSMREDINSMAGGTNVLLLDGSEDELSEEIEDEIDEELSQSSDEE